MIDAYFIHLLIMIGIYLILALSLQLSVGYTGLLNLGHIAFYGIGAYVSALLAIAGFPFWLCILLAGILPMIFGYIISLPTNRLKGDYLALVTLGFSFIVYAILLNWTNLTGGPLGLPGIPRPTFLGINFTDNGSFLILTFVLALITYLIIKKLSVSPFGKVLEATRDDELATKALGKNTAKAKSISLMAAAFFAGVAGCLFASYLTFIDPSSFSFSNLIPILVIIMIGGLGSLEGTILATILVVLLPEPLRFIGLPSSLVGAGQQIIYALILLFILAYQPKGFYGKVKLE